MRKLIAYIIIMMFLIISLSSCKRQDNWLNEKTNKNDVVPESLADYQAILDNSLEMNKRGFTTTGLVSSDNILVADEDLQSLGEDERKIYLWERSVWSNGNADEWNYGYRMIEFSNLVLDGLKMSLTENDQSRNIKGQAHFFRAAAMYNLSQLFCLPYVELTAADDLGLPIRESSDVNIIITKRSSLKETYDKIIADLLLAADLLPLNQQNRQRPSLTAAKAMLAKVYLSMEDYSNAGKYAAQALSNNNSLLDFNSNLVSKTATYPFPIYGFENPEVIFFAETQYYGSIRPWELSPGTISPELYELYETNDLRRTCFYAFRNGGLRLKGTYTGTFSNFSGIANNELYLIRAEALVREGDVAGAIADINQLLNNRYITGTFTQLNITDPEIALRLILTERRKELPFTGNLRWEDLRRLNRDPRFRKTLRRISQSTTYILLPEDKRYVFPIPEAEISLSGIEQNER